MTTQQIRLSNRTVVDLNKIAYAGYFYRSGEYERELKPKLPTLYGKEIEESEMALHLDSHPDETVLERAKRRGMLDSKWIPVLVVVMNNGHRLEFTGKKAESLKKALNAKLFSNGGK